MMRCVLHLLLTTCVFLKVNGYTTRSYDLEVPGSKPIRIIEADPVWDRRPQSVQYNPNDRNDRLSDNTFNPYPQRGDRDDRLNRPDFEHRTLRPDVLTNRNDHVSDEEYDDNSEKLKKFLNEYAQNIRKPSVEVDNDGSAKDELLLNDKFEDYPDSTATQKPERSKSWNLLHFDKIQNSPSDEKGWVSMEAVPWSVSKISKWHGKPKKDKYQNGYYEQQQNSRPYNDRFHNQPPHQTNEYPRPNYPKPIRPINNNRPGASSYYDDVDEDFGEPAEEDFYNKRPTFSRPTATYGHKVNLHAVQSYGINSGNKHPFKHDANCNKHQHNYNHQHEDGGIITDGLPANFPDHDYGNRRRGVSSDSQSSATHPFKGDGEWVLLSTTKGFKYPKNRQRSIQFSDAANANAIDTHKSVRLTVLPPLDDGIVNMTTSHGGLLQVDATFQTVDQAQRAHAKRQKLKTRVQQQQQRRPVKINPQLGNLVSPQRGQHQQQVQYQLDNRDSIAEASSVSDSNAVLAAVGAGMIPAGMALLVPMAMSGKRRRRQVEYYPDFAVTSPYTERVELTLPSTL